MTQAPSRALLALLVAAGVAATAMPASLLAAEAAAPAASAASGPEKVVRPETVKLLKEAQDAAANKDWVTVLAASKSVEAVGNLTPFETFVVTQYRAIAYVQLKDSANAAIYLRKTIDSPYMATKDKVAYLSNLVDIYTFDASDPRKALATLDEYESLGGSNPEIVKRRAALMDRAGDAGGALSLRRKQVDADIAAGRKPDENALRQIARDQQLNDDDESHLQSTLRLLMRYYPHRDIWLNLVESTMGQQNMADKMLKLELSRLRRTTVDYAEKEGKAMLVHASLAVAQGFPAEGRTLYDGATERGLVPADLAARIKTEREAVQRELAKEKNAEKANEAAWRKAKDVESLAAYGLELTFDPQQADRGLAMIEPVLAKATGAQLSLWRVRLGNIYLRLGRNDDARKAFQSVTTKDGAGAVASLALLWMDSAAKPQAAAASAPAASR